MVDQLAFSRICFHAFSIHPFSMLNVKKNEGQER